MNKVFPPLVWETDLQYKTTTMNNSASKARCNVNERVKIIMTFRFFNTKLEGEASTM